MAIKAGLGGDLFNFIWVTIVFGVVMFFIANFLIKKFNFATPGRNGNYENDNKDVDTTTVIADGKLDPNSQIVKVINLLGGKENIMDVDACMTRLRVSVKDPAKVGGEPDWKNAGAMGLLVKDKGVQAVYGPKADILKSDIQDAIDSGMEIPQTEVIAQISEEKEPQEYKGVTETIVNVADGEVKAISAVNDPVFSQKMMGDGFGVEPKNGIVYAPVSGTVTSVFPTKHALGLLTDNGLEVLVHMGIDTVDLKGVPFTVNVKDGDKVSAGDVIAQMDLAAIKAADKQTTIIVAFTNADEIKSVTLTKTGELTGKTEVAKVAL